MLFWAQGILLQVKEQEERKALAARNRNGMLLFKNNSGIIEVGTQP
jgi:hypothetical protein